MKVVFDTDIGSDIDDAVALAYLLAHPDCELLGITTVSGEPEKRAQMASAQCKVAGKQIPIYPGIEQPFLIAPKQPKCPQAAALSRWEYDHDFPLNEAVDFLRSTIRANPGEVTLLATGPMTNIALLFALDPEIPKLLKQLVMMVGVFSNQLARVGPLEWNAICDPHAIAKVYQTPVAVHRSIGLDVTCQVTMNAEEVRNRFRSTLLRPVLDFAEVWFEERPVITFHDPLAAASIFDDRICTFHRGQVEVELSDPRQLGMTYWQANLQGSHEIALEVDSHHFFEHYFSIVDAF
ncbi:MAG: nucleoside hydrolase [Anaerolineaceae bacterium]|nr:nucleoside hydrolase [Anaerolineaceae bacterium]